MSSQVPEFEISVKQLPSRGLPYPKGSKVWYKTYSWGEIREASISRKGQTEAIKDILIGIRADFPATELTYSDFLYLALARKISTFSGMQVTVPYICSNKKCQKENKGTFTERDIEFNDLSEEVTELPARVTFGDKELEFSPMTVGQYLEISGGKYNETLKTGKMDSIAIQASWIKNLDFKAAYEFVYKLSKPEDFEVITEIDKLLFHKIKPQTFKCPDCGTETSVMLEGRQALIAPFRTGEKPKNSRIQFGKGTQSASN